MKSKSLKTALITLIILLGAAPAFAASPFANLTKRNDIDVTYVSKYLVNSKRHALYKGGVNFSNLVPNIESIYVIEATNKSGIDACKQAMKEYLKSAKNCQVLMTSKDGTDYDVIYGEPTSGMAGNNSSQRYDKLIIYSEAPSDLTLIVVNEDAPEAQ